MVGAGLDFNNSIGMGLNFHKVQITVCGKRHTRSALTRANHLLYSKSKLPLPVIEAKHNDHTVGAGMQQALTYVETLNVLFGFSSNCDGISKHDRTSLCNLVGEEVALDAFSKTAQMSQH